jgi:hypothetical protein
MTCEKYIYPYHYPYRLLTIDELKCLHMDLARIDWYVTKYRHLFLLNGYHGQWADRLKTKYSEIMHTMYMIVHRGAETEKYTSVERTPILVADIDRYLREIIEFAQCRMDHIDVSYDDPHMIPQHWYQDQAELIKIEKYVHTLLVSITPGSHRSH